MVVADSCFSGKLVRSADAGFSQEQPKNTKYWQRMSEKFTRVVITSGGLEPVVDKGKSGHSPFANAFISALRQNISIVEGTTLFDQIRQSVMVATQQTPLYSNVRNAGHDGGDFLFRRRVTEN